MPNNPFELLYDRIVVEFQKHYRNVISYNTIRNPKPDMLTEANAPEVQVVPDMALANLGWASCETEINMSFSILAATGDKRLGTIAFPVMWQLLKAYYVLQYGGLEALRWNERKFVTDVSVGQATMELGAAERGLLGWACLWPITVRMSFARTDLNV